MLCHARSFRLLHPQQQVSHSTCSLVHTHRVSEEWRSATCVTRPQWPPSPCAARVSGRSGRGRHGSQRPPPAGRQPCATPMLAPIDPPPHDSGGGSLTTASRRWASSTTVAAGRVDHRHGELVHHRGGRPGRRVAPSRSRLPISTSTASPASVAEAVVDLLEVVEIEVQHRQVVSCAEPSESVVEMGRGWPAP